MTETELLLFDLRGENERLETQVKSARDKAAGLEERLREMAEQADSAAESFHLQPEIRELEMMCRQGLSCPEFCSIATCVRLLFLCDTYVCVYVNCPYFVCSLQFKVKATPSHQITVRW